MRRLPITLTALVLGAPALADHIDLTDGRTISDVTIRAETLETVAYRKDRKDDEVASDLVLMVHYSEKPQLVDSADAAIANDEFLGAEADLVNFLAGVTDRVPPRHPWSRAYALYRLVIVYEVMGQTGDLASTADRMATLEPDSRYLPFVIVKKAQALSDSGEGAKALSALGDLEKLIKSKGLSDRWKLELELGRVLFGSQRGAAQRKQLEGLSTSAGGAHPVVRNRAEVAIGASLLAEGKLPEAEKIFSAITADPKADDRTLAAAHAGLGQCLFRRGEAAGDQELLKAALKSYMRVVVLYKNEVVYLPEALFYAGRSAQLLGGDEAEERATKLYTKVIRIFPDSRWAQEARDFRRKK